METDENDIPLTEIEQVSLDSESVREDKGKGKAKKRPKKKLSFVNEEFEDGPLQNQEDPPTEPDVKKENPEEPPSNPDPTKLSSSIYSPVIDVKEYVEESKIKSPRTGPGVITASVSSYAYGDQNVVSPELLRDRAKSTRKLEVQRAGTLKKGTAPNRSATMKGKSKETSKYVDYTENPQKAPEPKAPKLTLKSINEGEKKEVVKINLIDGQTTKLYASKSFTSLDLFHALISRLNLVQYDLFWLTKPKDESGVDHWLDPTKTLEEQDIRTDENQEAPPLEMKVRWFKTYFKATDDKAVYYCYLQMSRMIIDGFWPVSDKVVTRLAAIQVQLNYGDFVRAKHIAGFFQKEDLERFVPKEVTSRSSLAYLQTRIFSFHRKLTGMQPKDAYRLYLHIARDCYFWGVTFYTGKGSTEKLGVAEDGFFCKPAGSEALVWVPFDALRKVEPLDDPSGIYLQFTLNKNEQTITIHMDPEQVRYLVEHICGYYTILLQQDTVGIRAGTLPKEMRQIGGLPNYVDFMRPKMRVPDDAGVTSMLAIVKEDYISECNKNKFEPNQRFLLQVENRLDNEQVLDILDLRGCKIEDPMFNIIVESLHKAYKRKKQDEDDMVIEDLNVHLIMLDGNQISDGDAVGRLLSFSGAKKVDLTANKLNKEAAKELAEKVSKNKVLEELILTENPVEAEGFLALMGAIKGNKQFKSFNFGTTGLDATVKDDLAHAIAENTELLALDLSDNQLGDECLFAILTSLNHNKSMEYLNLTKTNMTVASGVLISPFFTAHGHVTGFKVGYNKLNSAVGAQIGKILDANRIVVLDVRFSNIGTSGTTEIFSALGKNKSLVELVVSGNPINKKGLQTLSKVLSTNTTLQKLGMRYCDIGKSGFVSLSQGLSVNSNLVFLDVSHNNLDSVEACHKLSDALGHEKYRKSDKISKTVLNEINLSSCYICHKQMEELAEGLCRNRSLKTIHVDGNDLSVKGMRALALAVKSNLVLKIVTLQETKVDVVDVVAFMEKVGDDCSLDILDCRKNPELDAGSTDFVQARKRYNKYKVLL